MKFNFNPEEIDIEALKHFSRKDFIDGGVICPTCFDKFTNHMLYGDDSNRKTFEDEDIECSFVPDPRAKGHMIISTQDHYRDMSETPDYLNEKIIRFAREYIKILKSVYNCESVYYCTMSDGPINHYHVQLIPRYKEESRGSKNFVKPRKDYVFEPEKFKKVCEMIHDYANGKSHFQNNETEPPQMS